jgi:hypothetical protein
VLGSAPNRVVGTGANAQPKDVQAELAHADGGDIFGDITRSFRS